ncbi:PREDICTED: lysine-specific histone demethylase 1 homolog 1 [Camelina sativa]|uniref:Lysine-specific histone demethylase 1 homolog 1 n=1 Tax=Camelina sativa TaxID=90675 RepID=A0ABM0SZ88_CAMSA|nr:PREDICTED: lysine-specific histone demethylase 1 homolog 1 [Camelina sativa]XP_010418284.1 PREDICTED: lysine-specific histone demethylase 1 homolog 1 [Camelina sativa]
MSTDTKETRPESKPEEPLGKLTADEENVSDASVTETDLSLSPSQSEQNLEEEEEDGQNSLGDDQSPFTELQPQPLPPPPPPPPPIIETRISESLGEEESSDLVTEQQSQNPNAPEPNNPRARKRRRRKRFFTEVNSNPAFSRNRRTSVGKEVDSEALIAMSVGFPVNSLTEEEIEANVVSIIGGKDQANYIVVRNHIIALWRSNVSNWLTRDHALESIRAEHKNLVHTAYNFLLEHGYINFGLAPVIKEVKLRSFDGVEPPNVVVVGAGLAGLVAARQLLSMGFRVLVLEGRDRPGGRVKTRKMKGGDGVEAMADVGGSVLTGINGNPLGVLARQLGLPLHKVRDICPLYLPSGELVDVGVDSKIEASFNKLLDRVCKLRQSMIEENKSVDVPLGEALETFRLVYGVAEVQQERMLLDWHLANLEYANATLLGNLSMAYWDQDDPYEMGGDHCFIPGGNEIFVHALAENLPVFYGNTVESIRYGSNGVLIYAGDKEFHCDMALCTVPLGVLKKGAIEFHPELPQKKKEAIQRLGYGLLNKVAMLFPHNFWGEEIDTFGRLTEDSTTRGEFFLFYSYSSVSGGPLLVALVAGDAAERFETLSPTDSVKRVLQILRGIYHPKGIVVPDPVQALCSRWGQDKFSYGSYSYVAVGSSGDDYDILAESVGDGRVFFAGEATNRQYPATMHGAFLSGMREAANILRVARRRISSLASNPNQTCIDKEEEEADEEEDSCLEHLFETPDLSFENFSVLFTPNSDEPESMSLLRVRIQTEKLESGVWFYGLVTRKQAVELSELEGDELRNEYLREKLGFMLVERKSLSQEGESMISSLKAARLNRQIFD